MLAVAGPLALLLSAPAGGALGQVDDAGVVFPGNPFEGRRLFVERACYRCHAVWGNGGTLGPDFATAGAGRSLHHLAGTFWNHTPRMIEADRERGLKWPTFTETELADVISYIYYVKLFDPPGDARLGERWFVEKRCVRCHTVGAATASPGRLPLDEYARYPAPVMLAQGMWNHGLLMRRTQDALGIPTPEFRGREIGDLQAFIRRDSKVPRKDIVLLEPPNPTAGQRLYVAKGCVRCHGERGRGSAFAPDLQEAVQALHVSEIAGELWNHSSRMAAVMTARGVRFPRFAGSEMADIIAFLYYLRFYESDGDVATGERIFARKGCASCHAGVGRPAIGPDLSRSDAAHTLLDLATAMWNHAPAMYDLIRPEKVEWPRFEGDEMSDLSAYLRSLAVPSGPPP